MKAFILLAIFVSCASASHISHGGAATGPLAGIVTTGSSSQFRSEDNYGNYQFGYDETHATGSTARREERSGDVVRGSYNLGDADGRSRTVNYVADAAGFRASVHTNEPGVDAARDPADVLINKEAAVIAAPAPVLAAPLPAAPLPAAPLPAAPLPAAPLPAAPLPAAPLPATPIFRPQVYASPAPIAGPGPVYGLAGPAYEAQAPRAFSYSFGASHPTLAYAAPGPILAGPAPIYQGQIRY